MWRSTKCSYCGRRIQVNIPELYRNSIKSLNGYACYRCVPADSGARNGIDESALPVREIYEIDSSDYEIYYGKYADLIKRLEDYSAARQCHGGISAEAADAIKELCSNIDELEDMCGILDP